MRIPNGSTDQYIYFVAVDPTDLKTRETTLTTFTVYSSVDGDAAHAWTGPTVNEVDSTNMPGVYELLLDEDTAFSDSTHDTEEMCLHITHASMAPVTRTIELYRPETTKGNTLDVTSGGCAGIDWNNIETPGATVDLSATTIDACGDVTGAVGSVTGNVGGNVTGTIGSLAAQAKLDVNAECDTALTDYDAVVPADLPANFADMAITATTGRVDVGEWLGTAVTTSGTSNKPEVDIASIHDGASAAGNLESACNGYSVTRGLSGTALPDAVAEAAGGLITAGTGTNQISLASGQVTVATNNDKSSYNLAADQSGVTIGAVTGAVGSVTGNVGGNVTGSVGSLDTQAKADVEAECVDALESFDLDKFIQVSAGSEEPTIGSYLDQIMHKDGSQTFSQATDSLEAIVANALTATDINDEMVDVLTIDPISELTGTPSATPTFEAAVMFLYMALRNKQTSTSALATISNDAGTVISDAVLSDNGTTFTKDEYQDP